MSVFSINYKTVMVTWSPITFPQPVISNTSNSNDTVKNISAVYIYYQESQQAINQWQVVGVPATMISYNITDLKAYTDYELYMITGTSDGAGTASMKVKFKTIESGKRQIFIISCSSATTFYQSYEIL